MVLQSSWLTLTMTMVDCNQTYYKQTAMDMNPVPNVNNWKNWSMFVTVHNYLLITMWMLTNAVAAVVVVVVAVSLVFLVTYYYDYFGCSIVGSETVEYLLESELAV